MMKGTISVEFMSDTCFSMPATLNVTVDSDVCQDELGLPMIPGKTIRSLLRDTWLSAQPSIDADLLGYALFGREGVHDEDCLMRIGNAVMEQPIRERIQWALNRINNDNLKSPVFREAFYGIRVLTKMDRKSGAPETDTLRGMRVAPIGTKLFAPVEILENDFEKSRKLLDLLNILLGATRHAGLDRNRGLGHIRMKVKLETEAVTAPLSYSNIHPIKQIKTKQEYNFQKSSNHGDTRFYPYRLTLTAPCMIQMFTPDDNSSATMSHITGAAVRGAVAAAMKRRGESEEAIHEMVASGKVRFLNAYIEADRKRTVPTPCTFQREKNELLKDEESNPRNRIYDLFDDTLPQMQEQYIPLNANYLTRLSASWIYDDVKKGKNTHQSRNRKRGVSSKNETTVFVYEYLKEGQTFAGCLSGDDELCKSAIDIMLTEPLWLGRSSHAEYGGAPIIEFYEPHDTEFPSYNPVGLHEGDKFCISLTSPAILRDKITGQHDPYLLADEVEVRFNGKAKVIGACLKTETAMEYNRLWRNALPQLPAAMAGSTILLKALDDISNGELLAFQSQPIGERCAQGYGCFIVINGGEDDCESILNISMADQHSNIPLLNSETEELKAVQRRIYDYVIRLIISEEAMKLAKNTRMNAVSPHLIQRIRAPLHGNEDWRSTWITWFNSNSANRLKDTALKPLQDSQIQNDSLAQFLKNAAQTGWAPPLGASENSERKSTRILSENTAYPIWEEQKEQLVVHFLDSYLNRLARIAKEERENGD